MLWRNSKGVATKFWLGGGGRIHRHPNPPTQNLVFPRISATLFGKCWKMQNKFQDKSYLNIQISGGSTPALFKSAGVLTPATPVADSPA